MVYALLSHVIAYSHEVDEEALKKLQAKCGEKVIFEKILTKMLSEAYTLYRR